MFTYYLIRCSDVLSFVSAETLSSHIPCEVIGISSFSAPLSLDELVAFDDVLNGRNL